MSCQEIWIFSELAGLQQLSVHIPGKSHHIHQGEDTFYCLGEELPPESLPQSRRWCQQDCSVNAHASLLHGNVFMCLCPNSNYELIFLKWFVRNFLQKNIKQIFSEILYFQEIFFISFFPILPSTKYFGAVAPCFCHDDSVFMSRQHCTLSHNTPWIHCLF